MAKKYTVAKGAALTTKGLIYNEGEEIPDGVLSEESVKALLSAKKIVESGSETKQEKKTEEKKTEEKKE